MGKRNQNLKKASTAAEVLLSDEKRSRYDQFGHAGVDGQFGGSGGGFQGGDFGDLGDIFGDIFGDILGGGRRRGRARRGRPGNDLQQHLKVSFEESAFGTKKSITINRYAFVMIVVELGEKMVPNHKIVKFAVE